MRVLLLTAAVLMSGSAVGTDKGLAEGWDAKKIIDQSVQCFVAAKKSAPKLDKQVVIRYCACTMVQLAHTLPFEADEGALGVFLTTSGVPQKCMQLAKQKVRGPA